MKLLLGFLFFLLFNCPVFSQDRKDILFQATSSQVVIRQFSIRTSKEENFTAYYSAKHRQMLVTPLDFEQYPDSVYHLINARFTIFKARKFKDEPEQTFARIDYFYFDSSREIEIDCYGCTRNPGTQAVKDIKQQDRGDIAFIINDEARWVLENNGKSDDAVFYIERSADKGIAFASNYAIALNSPKWIVHNGQPVY